MEMVYWLWRPLRETNTIRRKSWPDRFIYKRMLNEKLMSPVSEFIMTNMKEQSYKHTRPSPLTVIKSKSLQWRGKIMRLILIPAEFTMTGWNFKEFFRRNFNSFRKMWGQSSCHSYSGEHGAWVLLCKLVRTNSSLELLNQTVLQVAQGYPILRPIWFFFPSTFQSAGFIQISVGLRAACQHERAQACLQMHSGILFYRLCVKKQQQKSFPLNATSKQLSR